MRGFIIALVIITVVCLSIAGIFVVVFGGLQFVNIPFLDGRGFNTYEINEEAYAPAGSYSQISLTSVSTGIQVVKWDNDYPKVEFTGSITLRGNKPELTVTYNSDTATFAVKYPQTIGINIRRSNMKLVLYVPRNYDQSLSLNTVSGSVVLNDFELTRLSSVTVSGRVEYSNINATEISASTVSGNITANNCKAETTSMNSTSGRVSFSGSPGTLNSRTVSGRVEISYSDTPEAGYINTVSGRVSVNLTKGTGSYIQFSTTSGGFSSSGEINLTESRRNFYKMQAGNPNETSQITITTVSGSLTVNAN